MAIPKTNATLTEMGLDCDVGIVPLSNIVLRRRAGNFGGSGNISTADLRGTVLSNQILKGDFDDRPNPDISTPGRDRTLYRFFDQFNVATRMSCSQDSDTGRFYYSLTHGGGSADVIVQSLQYGMLPDSGQFQVQIPAVTFQTGYTFFRVEVIGSKTRWLSGGNKIYVYRNVSNGESWSPPALDVDPEYRYLTISMGLGFPGRTGSQSRSGEVDGARAYLI